MKITPNLNTDPRYYYNAVQLGFGAIKDKKVNKPSKGHFTKEEYYTVQSGDTLWGISQRYDISLNDIIAMNPQIKNPDLIYPGDKVRVK